MVASRKLALAHRGLCCCFTPPNNNNTVLGLLHLILSNISVNVSVRGICHLRAAQGLVAC